MTKEKLIITGLGEVLWDIYPDRRYTGGAPANAAVHALQLGAHGKIISSVGNDENGRALLAELKSRGVDISGIQISEDRQTGYVSITLDEHGNPSFICSKDVAFDFLVWSPEMPDIAHQSHAVITGTLPQRNPVSRKTIQRFLYEAKNSVIVYDVNFREWNSSTEEIVIETAKKSDILKINEFECAALKKMLKKEKEKDISFIEYLTGFFNLKLTALTMGKNGALLTNGTHTVFKAAMNIEVKDTTGCGDSFTAAMILSFLNGESLESILDFAVLVSNFVATKMSAVPLYTKKEISEFAKHHN